MFSSGCEWQFYHARELIEKRLLLWNMVFSFQSLAPWLDHVGLLFTVSPMDTWVVLHIAWPAPALFVPNRVHRQSGFLTFISCQRQDAHVLPKRRQSHRGDKLCDVSTVPLVARWPVFLAPRIWRGRRTPFTVLGQSVSVSVGKHQVSLLAFGINIWCQGVCRVEEKLVMRCLTPPKKNEQQQMSRMQT